MSKRGANRFWSGAATGCFCLALVWAVGTGAAPNGAGVPPEIRQLRDITGIEEVPPAPAARWWPIGLGAGLAILCLGAAGWLGWKLARRRRPVTLPPEQWALAELDKVEALRLPEAGQVERYHTLLSDIVRRYLELRFGLHASRQSTEEFLAGMEQAPELSAPQRQQLRSFLQHCDLAKFARAGFSPEDCQAVAVMAREVVRPTDAVAPS